MPFIFVFLKETSDNKKSDINQLYLSFAIVFLLTGFLTFLMFFFKLFYSLFFINIIVNKN